MEECASEPDLNHLKFRTVGTRRTSVSGRLFFASTPTGNSTFREYYSDFREIEKDQELACLGRYSRFDNPVNSPEHIGFELLFML